ncbi:MAG: hypothetical protein ABSG80_12445 [Verrucomicrobiota bacterium]|jgi:hypothetical protein
MEDLDKDDLAVLCDGMTRDEVDRVHRLLHEWGVGPEDSFPVHLALLTRAQLRAAARIPHSVNDTRKWLEQHLTEYRRQTQLLLDDFKQTVQTETCDFTATLSLHAKMIEKAANQIQLQLDDAKFVAKHIKSLMERATAQWEVIKADTTAQCERLEQVSDDLQDRFAWRKIIWWAAWTLVAFGLGCCLAVNQIHGH